MELVELTRTEKRIHPIGLERVEGKTRIKEAENILDVEDIIF